MRILFLTQIIPYPPTAGPKIKSWHVLRYLAAQGHLITLASFIRPDEEGYVRDLWQVCSDIQTVPIHRSRLTDGLYWLRSHLTGRPFLVERDDLRAMRALVRRLLAGGRFDCIHADQLTMAQFALPAPGLAYRITGDKPAVDHNRPALVFDAHNAVWTIVDRIRQTMPAYMQPFLKTEVARIKKHEGMLVNHFDHTLAVTEIDRRHLLQAAAESQPDGQADRSLGETKISVVPIAVDTKQVKLIRRQPGSINILTLGTLHYPPNADGIRWFAREVFPLICQQAPKARLTIIGKNPPQDFGQLAGRNHQSIEVTGYVPDLVPYLEGAAIVVVPVRVGSGMRVRILEAFAHGMPVVTTTIGMEGIDARPGEDVLVADTPARFAAEVIRLLQDPELQERLAQNGRRLAEACYDWQVVLKHMDKVYPGNNSDQSRAHSAA